MKRRPLVILLFLVLAGVGLVVWNASRDTRANTFLLADGSELIFRGVTVGTNHSRCLGNLFQRMTAWIPGQIGDAIHGKTVVKASASSSTRAVFWFLLRKNPTMSGFALNQPAPVGGEKALLRYQWEDEEGNDFGGSSFITWQQLPSGDLVTYFYSYGVDLNSPTIHLKLSTLCGPTDKWIATEFTAPNPHYRKQP
jgi:hypothetical protein